MSVINKKPFIQSLLDTLSSDDLNTLKNLLDGAEITLFRSLINGNHQIKEEDKGVSHCVLETKDKVFTGYLIYNNFHCVLVAYDGGKSQIMHSILIDIADGMYRRVDEDLSIFEFRKIVSDRSITKSENGSVIYNDGIEVKKNGDVVIGKNLEVDGSTKLNGGLEPIATYVVSNYVLNDYGKIKNTQDTIERHILSLSDSNEVFYGIGTYQLKNQKLNTVVMSGYSSIEGKLSEVALSIEDDQFIVRHIGENEFNLFRHTLTLTASDKTYILIYDSLLSLNCDSIADLRTIMKISSSHESEILPVCSLDMISTACLRVTTSVCQIGTNNVTNVSDKVDLK